MLKVSETTLHAVQIEDEENDCNKKIFTVTFADENATVTVYEGTNCDAAFHVYDLLARVIAFVESTLFPYDA